MKLFLLKLFFLIIFFPTGIAFAIGFTPNKGQVTDNEGNARPDVLFTSREGNTTLYFFSDRIAFVVKEKSAPLPAVETEQAPSRSFRYDLVLPHAAKSIEPAEQLPGTSNYYFAHCTRGIANVASYRTIIYKEIFEGTDLHIKRTEKGHEFIFVAKEVTLSLLTEMKKMKYEGVNASFFSRLGAPPLMTPFGQQEQPNYKIISEEMHSSDMPGSLRIVTSNTWCTYIGGGDADEGSGVAIDDLSMPYVVGYTQSLDLPVATGTIQSSSSGGYDAFVYKLDSNGNRVWATYYGGTGSDFGFKIKTFNDNVIFCGYGSSTDLPMTASAWQDTSAGSYDAFIVKLNSDGTLHRSTYFGGQGGEFALALSIDSSGNVIMGGSTSSSTLPVTSTGHQQSNAGPLDAYCVKLDSTLTGLWCTFYGGSASEDVHGLTTDANGNIILAGGTYSNDFPVSSNAFQSTNMGAPDAYVVKLNATGVRQWATMLGGGAMEDANTVVCDKWDNIYISGYTHSIDFPVTPNAYQQTNAGGQDVFVSKLDPSGGLKWSTYYGGAMEENALGIASDTSIHVFIAGFTRSTDLPVSPGAFQTSNTGSSDAFFLRLDTAGTFGWATYFGGIQDDRANELAVDAARNVFITGTTYSNDLPDTSGVFQPAYAGNGDAFAAMLDGSYGITVGLAASEPSPARIYPNPSRDKIFIVAQSGIENICIKDMTGRTVKETRYAGNEALEIDISPLLEGIYHLIIDGRYRSVVKIIKM